MQRINTRPTKDDKRLNQAEVAAKVEMARKLRRTADAKLALALASIDGMGAHESFKAQERVRALIRRYNGCKTHRQVDAVYHDEAKKGKDLDWFGPINAMFRELSLERVSA